VGVNTLWRNNGHAVAYWNPEVSPEAAWNDEQLDWLTQVFSESQDKPVILVIHAPIFPLPPSLTRYEQPIHGQGDEYTRPIMRILRQHPRVRLVLAGHSHVTCAIKSSSFVHLTTASAIETPHQCRCLEVKDSNLNVKTINLITEDQRKPINYSKAWVLGRKRDQHLDVLLNEPERSFVETMNYQMLGFCLIFISGAAAFWLLKESWPHPLILIKRDLLSNSIVSGIAILALFVGVKGLTKSRRYYLGSTGYCPDCGNNLMDSPDRCSECGLSREYWPVAPPVSKWQSRALRFSPVIFSVGILLNILHNQAPSILMWWIGVMLISVGILLALVWFIGSLSGGRVGQHSGKPSI